MIALLHLAVQHMGAAQPHNQLSPGMHWSSSNRNNNWQGSQT